MLLPKAQCNCPVIVHSSTAQRVGGGGPRSCEHSTFKISQFDSEPCIEFCCYPCGLAEREKRGAQSEIGEHALRLNETCYTCHGKLIEQSAERSFSYAF